MEVRQKKQISTIIKYIYIWNTMSFMFLFQKKEEMDSFYEEKKYN